MDFAASVMFSNYTKEAVITHDCNRCCKPPSMTIDYYKVASSQIRIKVKDGL